MKFFEALISVQEQAASKLTSKLHEPSFRQGLGEQALTENINHNKKKEKDMSGKTISVDVPEGFEFVQEGNVCFFRRLSKDFSVWKSKYSNFIRTPFRHPILINISKLL
jgi:hypothetical protein